MKDKMQKLKEAIINQNKNELSSFHRQNTIQMLEKINREEDLGKLFIPALIEGQSEVVRLLIENGVDLNITEDDMPASYYAIKYGEIDIVKLLVKKYSVKAVDKYGMTFLHYASMEGRLKLARFFIENGADVNAKNNDGKTALHYAASEQVDIARLLIENGANIDEKDNFGRIALHYAASGGQIDVARLLVAKGANIDEKDAFGETALHFAIASIYYMRSNRCLEIIELLVINNRDVVNAKDEKYGKTALHYAAERGYLEAVEILVRNNADLNVKDNDGNTALHYAIGRVSSDVAEFLIQNGAKNIVSRMIDKKASEEVQEMVQKTASANDYKNKLFALFNATMIASSTIIPGDNNLPSGNQKSSITGSNNPNEEGPKELTTSQCIGLIMLATIMLVPLMFLGWKRYQNPVQIRARNEENQARQEDTAPETENVITPTFTSLSSTRMRGSSSLNKDAHER